MAKFFALFAIFSFAVLAVNAQDLCNDYGGVCLDVSLCRESGINRQGLCEDSSLTCCLGTSCHDLGGECIDNCPSNIWEIGSVAVGCPKGTHCCVWL